MSRTYLNHNNTYTLKTHILEVVYNSKFQLLSSVGYPQFNWYCIKMVKNFVAMHFTVIMYENNII
jgi:hypothetical protein